MRNPIPNPAGPLKRIWRNALAGALVCLGLGLGQNLFAQSYAISNLWSLAPDASKFLNPTNHLTRGLAYNPASGHLLVASRTPLATATNAIYIMDATNGTILGQLPMDLSVISGGTFLINMIGVTEDGVIYVGNLVTDAAGSAFKLYRWASESAQPTLAYSGDPSENNAVGTSPRRFGDSLALRGTGAGTQILLGTFNKLVALLTTSDGVNFTATPIATDMAEADSRWGLAWGAGNTFWVKQGAGNLKNLTINMAAKTAATTISVPLAAGPGGPLDVDLSRNLLAIVDPGSTTDPAKHKLRLFDISNPAAIMQVGPTMSFPAALANGNFVGDVSMRNGLLFALETNNGLLAYYIKSGVYYPVVITTSPASVTLWEKAENWKFNVALSGTGPFSYQWQRGETNLDGQTGSSLSFPAILPADQGSYRVVVTNFSGSATSSVATLTVQGGNASDQVTNIWNVLPDTRPYVTSGYKEYGIAINPVNQNVLVLTRQNPTNMLVVLDSVTGAEKHYIDYFGLLPFTSGYNRVGVADDGTVYLCNLSTDTTANPFRIDGLSDDGPVPLGAGRQLFSGDPGNGQTSTKVVWGGTMAVRGAGANTQILLGSGSWDQSSWTVAILQADAFGNFTSTPISVYDAPDKFARLGICWGPGTNTFWAKSVGQLVLVEFDLGTWAGHVKKIYPITGSRSVPSSITGIGYHPGYNLLAGIQNGSPPSPVSVPVYDVSDLETGPFWVDQELFTTYNADIEFQGQVDFAGDLLVALGLNNGIKAFRINPGAAKLPIIVTHPVGGSWFAGSSPTLSVVADGLTALSYQWYFNGTQALAGATSASLTLTNIQTIQAGAYSVRVSFAGGSRDSLAAVMNVLPLHNTGQMTNIWAVQAGSRPYLNTGYFDYGMSFNPANSNLLVASYVATNATPVIIAVMDALSGVHKHELDVSMVSGGNRWVNKIGVANDGVVYAANRTTAPATVPFVLYRWANDDPGTIATVAYSGDPFDPMNPNKNVGWTMDVRGSGVNTEILLSTGNTNVVALLTTTDGQNFTARQILVPGAAIAFARLGICFGEGNTFWAKAWQMESGKLLLVQYDAQAGTGVILRSYDTGQVAATLTSIAYNDNLKFLAGIARDDQKNVQLYSLANLDNGPVLLDQELFPTYNPSIEANGAVDFGGNTYVFALNENNGVMAFRIDSGYQPPVSSFRVLSAVPSGNNVTLTWEAVSGVSYQVEYVDALGSAWQPLGAPVPATGPTASYLDTPAGAKRFYRVRTQ